MPIKIYSHDKGLPEIAWLCDDNWRLPDQVKTLRQWLHENKFTLKPGDYTADIGMSPREDAAGGGAEILPEDLQIMARLGIRLVLREYPPFSN